MEWRAVGAIDYKEEPFAAPVIKDGVVILNWPDGSRRAVSLRVFRIEQARAAKAITDYDAKNAEVVAIKGRGRDHAARS